MRTFNEKILTSIILSANRTSTFVPLKNILMFCIQAIITGTPTGTIKLQASADPETNDTIPLTAPTNWVDIANSSVSVSAAGGTMWNVSDVAYNYVRVVYTDGSSGSSTAVVTATFNGKGI